MVFPHQNTKRLLLGVISMLIVLIIGVALYLWMNRADSESDSESNASDTLQTETPDDTDDVAYSGSDTCILLAANAVQAQGEETFVDAAGATYTAGEAKALANARAIVDVTTEKDLVGYGELKFLSACLGEEAVLLAIYVPPSNPGGGFELLATTQAAEAVDDIPTEAP